MNLTLPSFFLAIISDFSLPYFRGHLRFSISDFFKFQRSSLKEVCQSGDLGKSLEFWAKV